MELEFETRTTDYLRQSIEGVCRQEQTLEVIVPDASPDAARVVYCGAQAVVRSRECRSGAIELTGGIQAGAVYLTEADGAPRALTAWLPFTLRLEHPAAKDDTQILMDCRVLAADARLVNSRKILFRAEVGAQIMGFAADRVELPLLKQTPPELQLRCRNYPLPLPAETAEKRFLVSDELTLPAGQPTPETILCVSTVPEITERRIVGSKAVFKGSAEIRILYQAVDESICAVSQTFPFSQYCQLAGDYDEEQLQLCMAVTSCDAELPTEGGTMAVSAGLLAQCLVTKAVTLPFCEDAFATHGTLQAGMERVYVRLPARPSGAAAGAAGHAAQRAAAKRDRQRGVRRLPAHGAGGAGRPRDGSGQCPGTGAGRGGYDARTFRRGACRDGAAGRVRGRLPGVSGTAPGRAAHRPAGTERSCERH